MKFSNLFKKHIKKTSGPKDCSEADCSKNACSSVKAAHPFTSPSLRDLKTQLFHGAPPLSTSRIPSEEALAITIIRTPSTPSSSEQLSRSIESASSNGSSSVTRNTRLSTHAPLSILSLPTEIIIEITGYLCASSAASFSLSCKAVKGTIGSHYLQSLALAMPSQKEEFLICLERDLSDHVYCHHCKILHTAKEDGSGLFRKANSGCRIEYRVPVITFRHRLLFGLFFCDIYMYWDYPSLRMAMNLYHLGQEKGEHLDHLWKSLRWHKKRVHLITEPRAVSGKLLFRCQYWIQLKPIIFKKVIGQPDRILEMLSKEFPHRIPLCPHITSTVERGPLESMIRCKLLHGDDYSCSCYSRLRQCSSCPMEYQIDAKDFGPGGFSVIVTTWKDFGSCMDPDSQKWKSHFTWSSKTCTDCKTEVSARRCETGKCIRFSPGSIQAEFERGKPYVFDSEDALYHGDRELLFRDKRLPVSWSKEAKAGRKRFKQEFLVVWKK